MLVLASARFGELFNNSDIFEMWGWLNNYNARWLMRFKKIVIIFK